MSFQFVALPYAEFEAMFALPDAELRRLRAVRQIAWKSPGYPCRVSLQDAAAGEEVLLLQYVHQPANSPFFASHAIYVRRDAVEARPAVDEVPEFLRRRLLSVRSFDSAGMMLAAEVTESELIRDVIEELLRSRSAAYLHVHNAREGCYLARVNRA